MIQVTKLSVVIITFNEEKNIGRCIDSLLSVADEFIILDSFSTDQTIQIIRKKGFDAIQRQWQGYSASKNFANSLATGHFILSIDADEELSPELIRSIQDFKKNPTADACEINRLTNLFGSWIRHSGWYPEFKVRLFKKGLVEWKGSVHEELHFTRKESSIIKLTGHLNHYSYPTIDSYLKKIFVYASLAAEQDAASGKKYSLLFNGLIKPWFMFIRKYFLQLGFMDGFPGFVIAINSAFERFLRFVYFRQRQKKINSPG